ncbi:MAG: LamG-like jellyroll fold domain-containing protein [Trinickia sp.]|uniref:LamG-like jellyroll fold domain-containing protein n=1 Tax=Trinickia sp. TaxID=2571163 RepID=UPI003F7D5E66
MSELFDDMLGADALTPTWTHEAQFGPLTSPLVSAGDKLIGVAEGTVFAVDIHNGRLARAAKDGRADWVYPLKERFGGAPRVTACDGAVYLMDGDKLVALRLADASPLPNWTAPKLGNASSLIAHRGVVMAVYRDPRKGTSKVAGFVAATGAKAFDPVEISRSSPGPAGYDDDAVFFAAGGTLHGVNLRSGDTRWTFAPKDDRIAGVASPRAAKSVVLASGRCLYGIGIADGKERFRIEPGGTGESGERGNAGWHTPVLYVPSTVNSATKVVNLRAVRPQASAQGLLRAADAEADAQAASLAAGVAIAANAQGDLICLSLADGRIRWRRKLRSPGEPSIIDGVVHIKTDDGRQLERFKVENGNAAGVAYALPNLPSAQPAVIANGALFLADEAGNIASRPYYAAQAAAYFDGVGSMVDIRPDGTQFDFGERNFTVEAWFRSSVGGEILCGYPTNKDPNAHGFRLNLAPDGQIRVAVFSADGRRSSAGRTNATGACDGNWHHVALVRRQRTYLIVLDGIAQEVRLPESEGEQALSIGGQTALVIGAFVPEQGARASGFFSGLIREVRLWNCALETTLIETNRKTALGGAEPQLLGLWRLDEVHSPGDKQVIEPHNAVSRHRVRARFVNRASRPTDLDMDRSAFPYLLRESAKQWPYANTWGARGQTQVIGSPALSGNGIVAFSTGSVLNAVGAQDGLRKWSMNVASRISEPVADGAGFLVLTQDDSLIRIEARTGAKIQVPAFAGMDHRHDEALPAPVVDAHYVAAATGAGQAAVVICAHDADAGIEVTLPGTPVRLAFCSAGLLVLTQTDGKFTLHLVDCKTGRAVARRRIAADAFCAAGSWVFVVADDTVHKLDARAIGGAPLAVSAALGCAATGLAVSLDADLLLVGTDTGKLVAFSAGELAPAWSAALPAARAGAWNGINPPVFDQAARIFCTTGSGTIAAVSVETGSLLGLYHAENGAIGTPAVCAGTVYTGCRDTVANALDFELDGAMHSIVFGETTALRLNLDRRGNPIDGGKQHAVIDTGTEGATLHLMEVHQSCVEAWVNVPRLTGEAARRVGGGIVGIVPTEESGFDINLWMEADGAVHYASRTRTADGWAGVHVKATTAIADGRWHHLAVSRQPAAANDTTGAPNQILLYVDGQAVPVEHLPQPAAPRVAASGLKAYVGATVADDLGAAKPFCGMIAEVRVWDTYRMAPEIVSRMQVKLRGDEPDLLAYWNFDYEAVHDSALQGHSGELALAPTEDAPAWWLTDLSFAQPNYAHITTAGAITHVQDDGTTVYSLTAKVCAADGSGMANQRVEMWYILRRPDDPASISIDGTQVQGVKPGTEPDPVRLRANAARRYSALTGADGTLKLTVSSPRRGHGPSLDLWTSFMPVNERFHVNVLIDNQRLSRPAPPSLTAQAKLIQDYRYAPGDKVDHKKDRSTWRIVLRARESNDAIRPREPITLWASTTTTIEVGGARHIVNSERSVMLDSEMTGELTVVLEADQLAAPTLYARAGFMHRNERIVISADQDVQQQLSTMKADDMTRARVTNWKRPEDGGKDDKGEALLNREHHEHAGDISQAVRQVASSAKTEDDHAKLLRSRISPARRKLAAMRAAENGEDVALLMTGPNGTMQQPCIAAMRQEEAGAQTDRVTILRTMAGIARSAPANPDAFRRSLGGAMGFVIEADGPKGFSYRTLHTEHEVMLARGVPTPVLQAPPLVGSFFDDLWSDIKDTATNIYDGAKRIVVTIGESVKIAITKMVNGIEKVLHTVVASVRDALNAVAGFFEQIAVAIKKVIAFLRALFDWGAILEAQRYLHQVMRDAFKMQSKTLRDKTLLKKLFGMAAGVTPGQLPAGAGSLNDRMREGGGRDSPVIAGSDGVQANSMLQKTRTGEVSSNAGTPKGAAEVPAMGGDSIAGIETVLIGLAGSVLDLSPGDLVAKLFEQLKKTVAAGMNAMAEQMADGCNACADAMDALLVILDAKIYIPFVSDLYKWITGEDLSLLSLLCLGLGVFFNTLYAFVTLLADGEARTFASDIKASSKGRQRKDIAAPESMLLDAGAVEEGEGKKSDDEVVPDTERVFEIVYMGARALNIVCDTWCDAHYYEIATKRGGRQSDADRKALAGVGMLQGACSALSAGMFTFYSQSAYHDRLKAVLGKDREVASRIEWLVYLTFSVQVAKSAIKVVASLLTWMDNGVERVDESTWHGRAKKRIKDNEYKFMLALTLASAGAIAGSIVYFQTTKKSIEKIAGTNVYEQYRWFTYRDVVSLIPLVFEFLYTREGVEKWGGKPGSKVYYLVALCTRFAANAASVALHGVGVFKYGKGR